VIILYIRGQGNGLKVALPLARLPGTKTMWLGDTGHSLNPGIPVSLIIVSPLLLYSL
jgi:hypothetical protein